MPLNAYPTVAGGIAEGADRAIRGLAALKQMGHLERQEEREAERDARLKVLQGREDTDYSRKTEELDINELAGKIDGGQFAVPVAEKLGLVRDGKIRRGDLPLWHQGLKQDEEAQHNILKFQRDKLSGELGGLEKTAAGVRASGDEINPDIAQKIQSVQQRLEILNAGDARLTKAKEIKLKQQDSQRQIDAEARKAEYERTHLSMTAEEKKAADEFRKEQLKEHGLARSDAAKAHAGTQEYQSAMLKSTNERALVDDRNKSIALYGRTERKTVDPVTGLIQTESVIDPVKGAELSRINDSGLWRGVPDVKVAQKPFDISGELPSLIVAAQKNPAATAMRIKQLMPDLTATQLHGLLQSSGIEGQKASKALLSVVPLAGVSEDRQLPPEQRRGLSSLMTPPVSKSLPFGL